MKMKRITFAVLSTFALSATALSLTACNNDDDEVAAVVQKLIEFTGVPFPGTDAEKRVILASPSVKVDGKTYNIGYNTILRSGDQRGTGVFGQLYDIDGDIITNADGSPYISNSNDHSTLLDVHGKVFMVSQFEDDIGAFYISELNQNTTTGALTPVSTKPINLARWAARGFTAPACAPPGRAIWAPKNMSRMPPRPARPTAWPPISMATRRRSTRTTMASRSRPR